MREVDAAIDGGDGAARGRGSSSVTMVQFLRWRPGLGKCVRGGAECGGKRTSGWGTREWDLMAKLGVISFRPLNCLAAFFPSTPR
jgi:hypothetical protein